MSSLRKSFICGIALIVGAFLFAGCEQATSNTSADITWTAQADGNETAASTKIDFTFAKAVAGLTAEQVTVIDASGKVVKGALTGSGINWSLGITVETAGDVVVKINRSGIDAEEQLVAVRKDPVIGWSAQANGTDGVTNSTGIAFTFDQTVAELTADDITITEGTGKIAKGELTGSGTSWSLGITVETAGDVAVSISKDGITTAAKNVAVYKAGEITTLTWSAQADGGGGVFTSTYLGFTFSGTVTGLTAEQIVLTADTGSVTKGELTLDGAEWKLGITVESAGDIIVGINKDGIETTTRKVAVHKSGEMAIYSWVAEANGKADTTETTAIVFTFSGAIADLSANTIALTDDTGAVTKGALTGSGTTWSLGITVNTAGNIKVKINSGGIENTERTIAVYKVPAPSDITYDIATDGGASTTSTKIDFTFDAAVEGLTAEQIIIANGTGAATKGALTGSGKNWSLAITVASAGNVKVTISKAGIEAAEKTVAVYKAAPPVNDEVVYDIAADGGASTTSTKINFTFNKVVTGLTADQITVTNDTGAVAKGTLTGNGTSWALGITVNTAGKVKVRISKAGIETAEKSVEVYKFVPPPDTTYTAAADGAANTTTSTKINFTFNAAVAGLTAGDISVVNDTGTAAKGSIAGSGTSWSLGISVVAAGNVKVKINKAGIEAAEKIVGIYKALPPPDITYTAAANGEADTTDSTAIVFVFASAVEGLTAEQITVTNDTGAVTKGALTGSGTGYSLGIGVVTAGNVKVKINKAGIEAAEKTVAAHKAPVVNNDISYGAAADGSATATSTKINFTFGAAVEGLTAAHISLANDTGAVTKGALSGSGTNYSLGITVNTAGNVKVGINKAGIEAAEKTVAVYRFIPPPDITYTATADGNATTTSTNINFVFNAAVTELVAGNISVGNGTGAVTKGTLTGSGANWSLGITVATAGSVKVKINKAGIEDTEKDVTVQKFIPATYTAAADGTANITTSTKIDFSFDKAIENLTAEQITVTDDTGAVTKGALTGSGISWSLGISVTTAGNVKVGIANPGIETTEKNVVVHKLVPLTYTATPDGGVRAASTKIDFSFGAAVVDLNVEQITLTGDTGAVTKGSLTGSGTSWSLGISVTTPGKVQVGIANPRIEDTAKNVTVYKPITYIAAADGASNTTTSTAIDFTFTAAVSDLAAGDISVTGGTGSVTTGGLTGSGKTWFLGITEVNTAGTVKVRINKDGIENVEKTVTAHKAAVSSLTGEVEFGQTSGSADVTVGTPSGGSDDPVASLDISAGEKGAVYFVAYKTTAQTITPSAANGVKVTVHTSGTVDGESADNETAVIEVKTGDLPFEGGTGSFTLTVNEAALDSRTINVSLSITANKTGAAAFKVTRDGQNKVETLERLGGGSSNFAGLEAAITWVETYAEADTEYLIRVEQNETGLPGLALSFNNNAGVTMRLRGTKEGPWILRHNNINNTLLAVKGYTYSAVSSNRNFITIGNQGSALVLGNNITVAGFGTSTQGTYVWQTLVYVMANAKLIMEPGSKITDWYSDMSGAGLGSPIYIQSNNQASRDPTTHGHLRIEGGSITNCIFKLEYLQGTTMTYSGLVYVSSREGRMALGSLYKAASTAENPIVFSGNSSNEMYIHSASGGNPATRYDLSQAGELSIPTQ